MPYFSVIIPVYNRGNLLIETIKSVLVQTFRDFELIIVDDGSTDNTKDVVMPFLSDRVRYFYQQNKRQGAARNLGIKHANGMFVIFLDHDDLWSPKLLESYYDIIRNKPDVRWIHGAFCWFNEDRWWQANSYPAEGSVWRLLLKGNLINTFTIAVKSTLLTDLKFDESPDIWASEDWEFNFRLAVKAPCCYQPAPLLFMRTHAGRTSNTIRIEHMAKTHFFALDKILNNPFMKDKPDYLKRSARAHGHLFLAENAYGRGLLYKQISHTINAFIAYPSVIFSLRWLSIAIKIFIPSFIRKYLREIKQKYMSGNTKKLSLIDIPLPEPLKEKSEEKP